MSDSVIRRSPQSNFVGQLRLVSIIISVAVIGLGCSVILGWLLDIVPLKSVFASRVTMKVSTALGLILGGVSLLLWHLQQKKTSSIIRLGLYLLPSLAIAFSVLVLLEYGFGWDLGTAWLSLPDSPDAVDAAVGGRMSPNTALGFVLFNGAILLLVQQVYLTAQLLIILILAIASSSLIGHIYNINSFYSVGSATGMAIHTAVGFIGLSFAFLTACSQRGWMRVVTREEAGGLMARWLLPIVVLVPPSLGGFFWLLFRGNIYYLELIVASRIMVEMILFGAVVWWAAKRLNQIDRQRQQYSQVLLDAERRFRAIFDQTFQFIGLLTPDGTVLEVNQTALDFAGSSRTDVVGKPFWQAYWGRISSQAQLELQKAIATAKKGEFVRYQLQVQDANKQVIDLDFSLRPIENEAGEVVLLIPEARDISQQQATLRQLAKAKKSLQRSQAELNRVVQELEHSNQELEEFASVVSHDLLSPLAKQQMFLDILEEDCSQIDPQGKDYLERIRGLNSRMERLIRNLLSYARVTTQAQPFVPVSLNDLINDAIDDLEPEITSTSAKIEVGPLPTIMGDRVQLQQLFQNLLQNALKFRSEQTPQIKIAQLENNKFYQIIVADNGIGFESGQQEKIFTPFHRLHSSSKYPGTGLGLAICDKIVRRHGGTISAQSQPQQGAIFTICLPCSQI